MILYTFEIIPLGLQRPPLRSDIVIVQVLEVGEQSATLRLFDHVSPDKYFIHSIADEEVRPGLLPRPLIETPLQQILDGI